MSFEQVTNLTGTKFRNSNNVLYLKGLFLETAVDTRTAVYTLKDFDYNGYPSLYRLYMEAQDPTEYSFAMANLDGWEHWKKLMNSPFFTPYLDRWREELELKLESAGIERLLKECEKGGPSALQAAKFLANKEWKKKKSGEPARRGRPKKQHEQETLSFDPRLHEELLKDVKAMN